MSTATVADYEQPSKISRAEAEAELSSLDSNRISEALVRLALWDSDWRWVQNQCLYWIQHGDTDVSGTALTCLGHLARIHGILDLGAVLPIIRHAIKREELTGRAEDALSDILTYASEKL